MRCVTRPRSFVAGVEGGFLFDILAVAGGDRSVAQCLGMSKDKAVMVHEWALCVIPVANKCDRSGIIFSLCISRRKNSDDHSIFMNPLITLFCSPDVILCNQTTEPLRSTSSTISGARVPLSVRPISAAKVLWGTHLAELRGVVSSIMRSTCSRERPLVSGMRM